MCFVYTFFAKLVMYKLVLWLSTSSEFALLVRHDRAASVFLAAIVQHFVPMQHSVLVTIQCVQSNGHGCMQQKKTTTEKIIDRTFHEVLHCENEY